MKLVLGDLFEELFEKAPVDIKKAFRKQAMFLKNDLRHPSLHAKKYDETTGLWQARVTKNWRFYFTIEGDTYLLHSIIPHPK